MNRSRWRATSINVIVGLIAMSGCGSAPARSIPAQPAARSVASASSESSTTTTAEPIEPETSVAATVDVAQVQDCVEYVQYGAFTGNVLLLGIWNSANQDAGTLRSSCVSIGSSNPATLADMSSQWTDIQTFIAASQTTQPTTAPTHPPATTAPPPPPATTSQAPSPAGCGDDSYIDVDGNCVPSPVDAPSAPDGATAQCNDGTYSFSQHHQGTCSHHGGVAVWL
ncbi:MAG: hypothetical protein JWN62_1963 [Acidimicrobiales bacterium]|nr:hypothetical protein [Acidimicrobiales bacterium]